MPGPRYLLFVCLFCCSVATFGQSDTEKPTYAIRKAIDKIKVDGIVDEKDWAVAPVTENFKASFPMDTGLALSPTEVRLTYDRNYLYVSAVCYDPQPGDYVVQSLRRDFEFGNSDAFSVFLDPFQDGFNGFVFTVNPYGAQTEGLIQNGGGFGTNLSWDNRWFSKVTRQPDQWVVEMAIPFKTLRYKGDITSWGINFARNDLKNNQVSSWSWVPRNFNVSTLAFTGSLAWDTPPEPSGANISIIPSVISRVSRDFQDPDGNTNTSLDGSLDAKVAVTSSLNLDLTVNPDFSQVDVDVQQTNLTRFSLFFPERRNFFLENSDLFGRFGFSQIRPFFSRRIGLNQGQTVPILAGARLSGKVNKNWRIGLMNLQTEGDTAGLPSQNYTVAAFQRQVWGRSNIGGIFVNRQSFRQGTEVNADDYNRIVGLDFKLASNDNRWRGIAFFHQAITPEDTNRNNANATWLRYEDPRLTLDWNHEYVGANYIAEVGFVPRNTRFDAVNSERVRFTYWRIEPRISYRFYPESSAINWHGPTLYFNHYLDKDLATTDMLIKPWYEVVFLNTSSFRASFDERYTRLIYDTDITFTDNPLLTSGNYHYRNFTFRYQTDQRKAFNANLNFDYGSYYIGHKLTYQGELSYRVQPWGNFSLTYEQNEITLPGEDFNDANISLIGARSSLSFTTNLFFTTFVQYNSQVDNLNINSRFQWRFKPMSDLFIVYTDNYDPLLNVKNRALVVKFVYWITL